MKKFTGDRSFSKQVADLNRRAMAQNKVVNLGEYRSATRKAEPRTVLIVDDELVMRNAVKRILEKDNFKVLAAKDSMELTKYMEEEKLDLILLDVNLPWVDGIELCTIIKSHPTLKNLPVALISGNKTEEDIRKGFEAGCDEYITKPFNVSDLQKTVQELLAGNGG